MAPDSRIVSLKLADRNGAVDVSQVIAAIDWVVQHRSAAGLNIRVLNLSYGTESPQSWTVDPLSWAAEVAWRDGIVVVTSAGNDGLSGAGLANPAYNPWLIAVGAVDTKGTEGVDDDVVPAFSARSGGSTGDRLLDVVAPGVGIVSAAVSGSHISDANPGARIGNGFIRGSGTSQAAAVVSGGVALLLQHRPTLTPNQVKALLRTSANPIPGQPATAQGSGVLSLLGAMNATPTGSTPTLPQGTGRGSLESARAGLHLSMDGVELTGELDIMVQRWDSSQMATLAGNRTAWKGGPSTGRSGSAPASAPTPAAGAGRDLVGPDVERQDLVRQDVERPDLVRQDLVERHLERCGVDVCGLAVAVSSSGWTTRLEPPRPGCPPSERDPSPTRPSSSAPPSLGVVMRRFSAPAPSP
jgi:serine protease AprX